MLAKEILQSLWQSAGGTPSALAQVSFSSNAQQLPSTFHVGPLASASIAAQALAAAEIWALRAGQHQNITQPIIQNITINQRHALAMFRSDRYLTINGQPAADPWSKIAGYYQAGDGRWIQLHTNFDHHRDGVLAILQCADDKAQVAKAILKWQAAELENALADANMCAAMIRTQEEWRAHPQAQAIAHLPLFEIERIGDGPAMPVNAHQTSATKATRPLEGVRVLDLSRVIAAPVGARTLAQHGADVLAISAAHLPNIEPLVIDTGRGKRSAQLDLRHAQGRQDLHDLVAGADVFLQAYRPGALGARGFSAQELCQRHPGLIYVSLSAWGHTGPWAERRGFDSLVQSASGIAHEEGLAANLATPGKLPFQALDHATGYLIALATMQALARRTREGGSYHIRLSLAQTGQYLQNLGRCGLHDNASELGNEEVASFLQSCDSPWGKLQAIAPVETMSATPAILHPAKLDGDMARWR